jgi:hypothetical protein
LGAVLVIVFAEADLEGFFVALAAGFVTGAAGFFGADLEGF